MTHLKAEALVISLTQQMMNTVKTAVLAGCAFDETSFPIIESLMYMDGLVFVHPHVDLITSMGPYLDEFFGSYKQLKMRL